MSWPKPSFTCPCCHRTEHDPDDAAVGYCLTCTWWTGDGIFGPAHMKDPCEARKP